jgi:hypothetical protein
VEAVCSQFSVNAFKKISLKQPISSSLLATTAGVAAPVTATGSTATVVVDASADIYKDLIEIIMNRQVCNLFINDVLPFMFNSYILQVPKQPL